MSSTHFDPEKGEQTNPISRCRFASIVEHKSFLDPKWRYFWRIGERPSITRFKELNATPVIPKHFPDWESLMNDSGKLLVDSVDTLSQMVAIGLGLSIDAFTSLTHGGPHLLAPTARFLTYNLFNLIQSKIVICKNMDTLAQC